MGKNLFGEFIFHPSDIAVGLLKENPELYTLSLVDGTKQGFRLKSEKGDGYSNITGFYMIYLDSIPLYCGYSMSKEGGIYNRISRWVKEVMGNSTNYEKHPAARKYRNMYGRSLSNLKVQIMPYYDEQLSTVKAIEKSLIVHKNPLLNQSR